MCGTSSGAVTPLACRLPKPGLGDGGPLASTAMTEQEGAGVQAELVAQGERQTELLSSINGALMFLLALAILGVLLGAAALWG